MRQEAVRIEDLSAEAPDGRKLRHVDLDIFRGEALGLVGLAASGSSLLVDVLGGSEKTADGHIHIGDRLATLGSETESRFRGIYRISREPTIIDDLTIAENIFILRRNSIRSGLINHRMINNQTSILLKRLAFDPSPSMRAGLLSTAEKQLVELAKALGCGAKIVIFDEAFARYDSDDLARIKTIIEQLKAEGLCFILRCNYLEEIRLLCDKVAIFREGHVVKKLKARNLDTAAMEDFVVGRTLAKEGSANRAIPGAKAFDVEGAVIATGVQGVSFSIRHGEVMGLVNSNADERERLAHLLTGKEACPGMRLSLDGSPIEKISSNEFFARKIIGIEDLARASNLLENMDIGENLLFPSLKKVRGPLGYVRDRLARMLQRDFLGGSEEGPASLADLDRRSLVSIELERWRIFRPSVLVMLDPYLTADIVIERVIDDFLREITRVGTAVIILASRPQKLEGACHSLHYIEAGRLRAVEPGADP